MKQTPIQKAAKIHKIACLAMEKAQDKEMAAYKELLEAIDTTRACKPKK